MGIEAYFVAYDDAELADNEFDDHFVEQLLLRKQRSIDKVWQVLHYILAGRSEADDTRLSTSILGGEQIGPELDYGTARLIRSLEVKNISMELNGVNFSEKLESADRSESVLNDIYLGVELLDEGFDGLEEWFDELKNIYAQAAERKLALVCYLA